MENNSAKVSIALCTYNGERFLQEQLDSITNQTRLPDEVVVGDDGSVDRTLKILENWAKTVPFPVRIQANVENVGYTKNFEQTLLRCVGDVIFLSDQDDVWMPEKLEKMIQVFETRPEVGLVYCGANTMDQNGKELGIPRSKISRGNQLCSTTVFYTPYIQRHNNPSGCCAAVRGKYLPMILPFEEKRWAHDVCIYRCIPAITEVVTLHQPLLWYRLHGENTSLKGNWCEKFHQLQQDARKHYCRYAGFYFLHEKEIQTFLEWVQSMPDSKYKQRYVRYIQGNQIHYPNRIRIQRNFFIFFPLFFLEVFTLRYFQRIQPIKSIAYDVSIGIWNGLNPFKTFQQGWYIVSKLFNRKNR